VLPRGRLFPHSPSQSWGAVPEAIAVS
jgi:hypothetical protein